MKCQNCSSEIPKGELFCPFCGQEVQLVPDYSTVDYMLKEKELREQEELKKRKEAQRTAKEAARQHRMKPWVVAVKCLLIAAGSAALGAGVVHTIQMRNAGSASFQTQAAGAAYERKDFAGARRHLDQAVLLDPDSVDLALLEAKLQVSEGNTEEAIQTLTAVTARYPSYAAAYDLLISIYQKDDALKEIVALVKEMPAELQDRYREYLVEAPVFSLEAGAYDFGTRLSITAPTEQTTVYYTTDGSVPNRNSAKYTQPIILPLGSITVRAVCINSTGVSSDRTEVRYQIRRVVPGGTGTAAAQSSR